MYPYRKPKNVIENVIIKVGTFSPIAPYTAKDSLATLLFNSFGFIVSNHPTSWCRIALK